ncbi:MAG: hypothetical protein LBP69_02325 [Treponema sp.]|nr:hypothetical protein [Treponema sp.]
MKPALEKPALKKTTPKTARAVPLNVTLLLPALLFFAGQGVFAADFLDSVDFSGETETLFASPFSTGRNLTEARTGAKMRLGAFAGETETRITVNAEYNPLIPSRTGAVLEEAWLRYSPAPGGVSFSLSLGRQFISWGAADGLILTDIVCPQNLVSYAGLDFAKSRLAVDGLSLNLGLSGFLFGDLSIEALWLPVFTQAKLPLAGDNPLNAVLFSAFMNPPTEQAAEAAKPKTIADGEYGLRLSFYSSAFDLSVCGFYGWNDIPYVRGSIAGTPPYSLAPEFRRMIMAGGDASVPVGDVLFRVEAAYTWGGRFNPDAAAAAASGNMIPVEKDRLQTLAGLDWNPGLWTITAQYYEDILPQRTGGTERDRRKNAATLSVSRSFLRDILNVSVSGYLGLQDLDTAIGAEAAWAVTDELEFSVGTDFFSGGINGGGDYAAYKDLSCVWVRGVYRF